MRRLLFEPLVLVFALAGAMVGWAESPSITVLTGTTVRCDSAASGGHPTTIEWFVTPPGETPPTQPTSTAPAFDQTVSIPGTWAVDLILSYDHLVDGTLWTSQERGAIEAKSVVADLDPGPLAVTTAETINLDGSGSQISTLAAASAQFKVDGQAIDGCIFPGPITDPSILICSFPASDLGPGTFVVSLDLTDSVGGITDTDEATLEVTEEPPFTIDFQWTVDGAPPQSVIVQLSLSEGWSFSDLQTSQWDFDDGSPADSISCPNDFTECEYWSHTYDSDGFYDVSVSVTTTGGHWDSVTDQVTIGDPPPPPTAAFSVSPEAASVNIPVNFTFAGSCSGVCSYLWDFDDGSTSTLLNPVHRFIAPIEREVSLTVTNGTGQDVTSSMVPVSNCWSPSTSITQTGSCYGAPISLTAPAADAVEWSTGATGPVTVVSAPALFWAHVSQGLNCWAYVEHTVSLEQCQGSPAGNVNMDGQGRVDAADLQAMIRELSDGDGQLVIDSWAEEIGAPGADLFGVTGPDGLIKYDDLDRLLELIFATE